LARRPMAHVYTEVIKRLIFANDLMIGREAAAERGNNV